jgi:hypothetical protein
VEERVDGGERDRDKYCQWKIKRRRQDKTQRRRGIGFPQGLIHKIKEM